MRKRLRRIGLAAVLVWMSACEPLVDDSVDTGDPPAPLDAASIQATLPGNSITSSQPAGPYTVYFPDAGHMVGIRSFRYVDRGVWRVTDVDQVCLRWDNWWGNVERCWQVYLDGEQVTWIHPYGESPESAQLVEGNPADLR